ncbi:fimbria/pilus outer membrane usher protein [Montanilutibacter psychrotolerans]|uniref:Fimbrial biogenesis outer membrane usher protein n=1 Tax=Montanilutibacter psychrotolerans TaxID=1327343 RepID=A0A3M8SXB3_9GAMM|nr:fimbria/pilus outer membrane usher protein [Lysobacter psychrotolerans]RNF85453.1 fimbrial biogenesis outer membrane usher protein [Lysobacter psychrotolerans]
MLALLAEDAAAQHAPDGGVAAAELPPAQPGGHASAQVLYLEVVLNRTRLPQLVRFIRRDGRMFADSRDLRGMGFTLPGHELSAEIALDRLPGVQTRYDLANQRIDIDAPLSQLTLPTTRLNTRDGRAAPITATAPGLLLNYDLYASHDKSNSGLTATGELRAFGIGPGVFSTSAVTRGYRSDDDGWRGQTVRLQSNWELSFPAAALTLTVGDTFSGFLDWTRPVRLGGVQIGRNFGLQPYRVTTPMPAFLGEVAVPSVVDLYVNGVRQYRGELPVGPFQLSTVPGISGVGNAHLVITDAFGRTRNLDFPFYSTRQLLAKGLSDWSLSAGTVRQDYGVRSFSYASEPVFSGNLRHGISDNLTLESHAEAGGGLRNAGLGGVWLIGRAGVFSASHARSRLDREHGSQTTLGYAWNNGHFNVSADSQRTSGDYRDIASLYGPRAPEISERALAGFTTAWLGNVGINYVRLRQDDTDAASTVGPATARYAGVSWTRNFARDWSVNLSYNRNLDDHNDRSLYLSIAVSLGHDHRLDTSWQRNNGRDSTVIDLTRPVPGDGGAGWRVQMHTGDGGDGGLAEVGWLGAHGRVGLGLARLGGYGHGYAQASGGLVWMGGHGFASRRIDDAFAVITTDGIGGVPVQLENRPIGHTDADGVLLVAPLNAWQHNKLSIDPMSLPAAMRIADTELIATPSDRAGARVRFAITPIRAALVVLHDRAGKPLPLNTRVRVEGSAADVIVGYDGETYIEDLGTHNRLRVQTPSGTCVARFDYPETVNAIPRIGPLPCGDETPR